MWNTQFNIILFRAAFIINPYNIKKTPSQQTLIQAQERTPMQQNNSFLYDEFKSHICDKFDSKNIILYGISTSTYI